MEIKNGKRNGAGARVPTGTRVIGVGGAGWHMLKVLVERPVEGVSLIEVNTDTRAMEPLEGVERHQIGARLTRGMGAGGDPEIGARAATDSAEEIGDAIGECAAVVLLLGLGGGTATGAAPIIAAEARRRGARTVALCALPFEFEGPRRREQAEQGLEALRAVCDAVFAFENDRLSEALSEDAGVEEAFGLCSEMLARTAVGIHRTLARRGIIDLDAADLVQVLGADQSQIAWSNGSGEHRLNDALDRLLACPLLRASKASITDVVAQLTGGPEMSLSDVQKITKRIRKEFGENISVRLGASIDPGMRGQIEILVFAASIAHRPVAQVVGDEHPEPPADIAPTKARIPRNGARVPRVKVVHQMTPPPPPPPPAPTADIGAPDGALENLAVATEGASGDDAQWAGAIPQPEMEAPAIECEPALPPETFQMAGAPQEPEEDTAEAQALFRVEEGEEEGGGICFTANDNKENGMVQSAFNFESPSRGRFDKTEVTMYKGENLDIPTFMRRRIRITAVE